MRIDGTRLDLRTMANVGQRFPRALIGGRRCLQILGDRVHVSRLAPGSEAGIGIGIPHLRYVIFCLPDALAENAPRRAIDHDGWLDVTTLTPGHRYWLELDSVGGIRVEREDSDGEENRWYWPLPADLWRRIRCG